MSRTSVESGLSRMIGSDQGGGHERDGQAEHGRERVHRPAGPGRGENDGEQRGERPAQALEEVQRAGGHAQ
jgi:hypothetical protein